ncbi:TRAP transporter small permease [Pseudovibrio flavus]|uniref:TRAP transporter small permease n=1 Tax=Pseudovibrio flavus TaxID=2529854 RepID=UPI00211B967D|nr:TRAP transporter small permease [Pseudovibrio flavus]
MQLIKKLDENLEKYFLIVAVAAIAILIMAQVFMRYVMGNSLSWSEELVRWTFVWFIWIGVSYGFKTRKHISITVLPEMASPKVQRLMYIAVGIAMIIFFAWLAWIGYKQCTSPLMLRQRSPVLEFPFTGDRITVFWLYASLPVGSALSVIRLVQNVIIDIRALKDPETAYV